MNRSVTVAYFFCFVLATLVGCDEHTASGTSADMDVPPSDAQIDANGDARPEDSGISDTGVAPDEGLIDAEPVGQFEVTEPVDSEAETLMNEAIVAVVPAARRGLVVQTENAYLLVDGAEVTSLWETGPDDELRGGTTVGDDFVIATNEGLFSLFEGTLRPSPAQALLGDVFGIESDENGTVWITGSEGIHAWSDGQLFEISSADIPDELREAMVTTAPWADEVALWIAQGSSITGLTFDGRMAQAWTVALEENIEAMTGNSDGLWILTESELKMMGPDGLWLRYVRPDVGQSITASIRSDALWLHAMGFLSQIVNDALTELLPTLDFTDLVISRDGSALLFGDAGLFQVRAGRFISITGLKEGDALNQVRTVSISVPEPESVTSFSVALDGEPLDVGPDLPVSIELNPVDMTVGNHTFSVTVRYDDEDEINTAFEFLGPPGWNQHIEPLFDAQCAMCHGNRPDARSLETPMSWIEDFDLIVFDVETGRMPLGLAPLSPEEVDMVRGWGAGGFQE